MKVLVVEDESKIATAIQAGLNSDGYEVSIASSGEEAYFLLQQNNYALVVLDWMLPNRSGVEILQTIRIENNWTPVIMLTAKDTIEDRIQGLDVGADDYLVKPFSLPELQARTRSLIRRNRVYEKKNLISLADLELDVEKREVKRAGQAIELTNREFGVLHFLLQNLGKVVSRDMLSKEVWKINNRMTSMDSVIDVHMNRLRSKIDKEFKTNLIKTIRGVGFKICE